MFKVVGTKEKLFVAVVDECFSRIADAFSNAAAFAVFAVVAALVIFRRSRSEAAQQEGAIGALGNKAEATS